MTLRFDILMIELQVKVLHEDDIAASDAVGETTHYLSVPRKIPTDKEMQELKEHIKKMKVSKYF